MKLNVTVPVSVESVIIDNHNAIVAELHHRLGTSTEKQILQVIKSNSPSRLALAGIAAKDFQVSRALCKVLKKFNPKLKTIR